MFRQILILIVLSILAILFLHQVHLGLRVLVDIYYSTASKLSIIFAGDGIGRIIRDVVALLIIPAVIGLIFNLIYWLFTRHSSPALMPVIWAIWLVLLALLG